jgi:hypothetical protein
MSGSTPHRYTPWYNGIHKADPTHPNEIVGRSFCEQQENEMRQNMLEEGGRRMW